MRRFSQPSISSASRLNRRALLRNGSVAAAGLAATSILACNTSKKPGGNSAASASPSGQQAKRGGTLNYSGGFAGSYDTWGSGFDPDTILQWGAHAYTLFYQRLVAYNLGLMRSSRRSRRSGSSHRRLSTCFTFSRASSGTTSRPSTAGR